MLCCRKCGHQCSDDSLFCSNCGTKLIENSDKFCPKCGNKMSCDSNFCSKCGFEFDSISRKQFNFDKEKAFHALFSFLLFAFFVLSIIGIWGISCRMTGSASTSSFVSVDLYPYDFFRFSDGFSVFMMISFILAATLTVVFGLIGIINIGRSFFGKKIKPVYAGLVTFGQAQYYLSFMISYATYAQNGNIIASFEFGWGGILFIIAIGLLATSYIVHSISKQLKVKKPIISEIFKILALILLPVICIFVAGPRFGISSNNVQSLVGQTKMYFSIFAFENQHLASDNSVLISLANAIKAFDIVSLILFILILIVSIVFIRKRVYHTYSLIFGISFLVTSVVSLILGIVYAYKYCAIENVADFFMVYPSFHVIISLVLSFLFIVFILISINASKKNKEEIA